MDLSCGSNCCTRPVRLQAPQQLQSPHAWRATWVPLPHHPTQRNDKTLLENSLLHHSLFMYECVPESHDHVVDCNAPSGPVVACERGRAVHSWRSGIPLQMQARTLLALPPHRLLRSLPLLRHTCGVVWSSSLRLLVRGWQHFDALARFVQNPLQVSAPQ